MKRTTFMLLLALLLTIPTAVRASANPEPSGRSAVLPATAEPYGISLTDMARRLALFESSLIAGTPITPPRTPFEILNLTTSNYVVDRHTVLYVPLVSIDDSPPVTGCVPPGVPGTPGCVGVFPANHKAALRYTSGA